MATTQRPFPYVWTTWLTKLLAGEDHCEWALWFRAHFKYDKLDRGFDQAAWASEHDDRVRSLVTMLRERIPLVYVEDQNKFELRGNTATLSGKPDVVAIERFGVATFFDVKTGKQRKSDWWQVLVYIFAARRGVHPNVNTGDRMTGQVVYGGRMETIAPEEYTAAIDEKIAALMRLAGQSEPPARTPSSHECAFCDIGPNDCPVRVGAPRQEAMTNAF